MTDMEPGRDLDKLIAQKVFGYEPGRGMHWNGLKLSDLRFSTDIKDAWKSRMV